MSFLVFDQEVREKLGAINGYVRKGFTVEGATVEELAGKIGVDAKGLVETMAKYNGYVKAGEVKILVKLLYLETL